MRNRFGRALYGLAATVAVTATLGLTAAGRRRAATADRQASHHPGVHVQQYCSDPLFNVEFGIQFFTNNNELDPWLPGNPVNLNWANDNNPGEDWRVTSSTRCSFLYHLGFISAGMELHYHFTSRIEVMWTPYGVSSNLCRGVARTAYAGREGHAAALRQLPEDPLGRQARLLLERPVRRQPELINGSTMNPSVPYVLTAGGSLWGGNPFATLQLNQPVADDGVVNPGQLWCTATETFPLQSTTPSPTPSVGPPTIGPPTYLANQPTCFPSIDIG